jgi:hypothetical protein
MSKLYILLKEKLKNKEEWQLRGSTITHLPTRTKFTLMGGNFYSREDQRIEFSWYETWQLKRMVNKLKYKHEEDVIRSLSATVIANAAPQVEETRPAQGLGMFGEQANALRTWNLNYRSDRAAVPEEGSF